MAQGNLAGNLTASAERFGERVAQRLDDVEVSYALLDEASARVAGLLAAKGVGPGDRVGIMLPNVPSFAVVYYGILRLGAVVVPMNVLLKGREVVVLPARPRGQGRVRLARLRRGRAAGRRGGGRRVRRRRARRPRGAPGRRRAAPRGAGAGRRTTPPSSSTPPGTTGTPKGAELTHANLGRNAEIAVGPVRHRRGRRRPRSAPALPLLRPDVRAERRASAPAALLTLIPRFDPDKALEIIERDQVTVFEGVPTMYSAMLHCAAADTADTSSLRVCASGGAALPVEVLRAFEAKFGCQVLEGYGLSETSPVASFNHPGRERKPGSIGTPIDGVEMKVVGEEGEDVPAGEVGEIAIRGHNVMKGYWGRPDATAEAIRGGWFHSGDLARVDDEGYFYIVDRKKDMIIRGGYNVYPREIEEVLYEHPAVAEAAVIGVPHPRAGRGGRGRGRAQGGRGGQRRRPPRPLQGAGRRLQVPAARLLRRGAAEGADGQDPQARDRGAGRGAGPVGGRRRLAARRPWPSRRGSSTRGPSSPRTASWPSPGSPRCCAGRARSAGRPRSTSCWPRWTRPASSWRS